jgi:hypothetical protein
MILKLQKSEGTMCGPLIVHRAAPLIYTLCYSRVEAHNSLRDRSPSREMGSKELAEGILKRRHSICHPPTAYPAVQLDRDGASLKRQTP